MGNHIAPLIREMDNARIALGNIQNLSMVGYTERNAQEGVTQPTPITTPNGGLGNFWFLNQKTTPTL